MDIKDLRPAFLRLLPSFKDETDRLPAIRMALQRDVRLMTRKYGPELGAVYYGTASKWEPLVRSELEASKLLMPIGKEEVKEVEKGEKEDDTKIDGVRVKTEVPTNLLGAMEGDKAYASYDNLTEEGVSDMTKSVKLDEKKVL
jgi:hypothetical protein